MNKKTIYVVVAVIVVILIVGVAGVLLLNNSPSGGDTNPTPTPEPVAVSEATSIQFAVEETSSETSDVVIYQFAAKNLDTETEILRVDMDMGELGKFSYIVDKGAEKSWTTMDEGATWSESNYADDLANYDALMHSYIDKMVEEGDNTEDVSYTTDTASILITCIVTNPTLSDDLFAVS
ncbi:MAG: hypothetical protein ACM3UY_09585 [Methanocella sp.]